MMIIDNYPKICFTALSSSLDRSPHLTSHSHLTTSHMMMYWVAKERKKEYEVKKSKISALVSSTAQLASLAVLYV
jgi:hypothetical protein